MNPPPLPQQRIMTQFMLDKPEAAILADPGLGKSRATIDAISFLLSDASIRGVLIIAPLRVCLCTWPTELARWAPHLVIADLRTEEGMAAWKAQTADVYLTNFEQLASRDVHNPKTWQTNHYPGFIERGFRKNKPAAADMLVIDELSVLKNPSSKTVKALALTRNHFTRFVGLTGTPTPQSTLDLFSQIKILDGGKRLGTSFHAFRNRYAESDFMGYKWTLHPESPALIREKVADMCLVQRDADWADLPPVHIIDVPVTLPPEVMKQYRRMEKDMLIQIGKKEFVALTAASLVSKLLQITSGVGYVTDEHGVRTEAPMHNAKIDKLNELHAQHGRDPMLVFTAFQQEPPRITAAVPGSMEFDASRMNDWDEGRIPMAMAHPKSISHGLNCQKSCNLITWVTPTYNSEHYQQGNKRVARIGQTKEVFIYRLIVPGTIDEAVIEALRVKGENQNADMLALQNLRKMREAA